MGDYFVTHLINSTCTNCVPTLDRGDALPVKPMVRNITDGLSNTVLVHEQAGRPASYIMGVRAGSANATNPQYWGPWASYNAFQYQGWNATGTAAGNVCSINCNNSQGTYSFHPGGANFLFCDGTVRFIGTAIPVDVLKALLTRNGNETVPQTDY